jgi:hypothetical protein
MKIKLSKLDLSEPVIAFFEEGDWLRIVCQDQPDRFMRKKVAQVMLKQIAAHSSLEKSDLIVV